MLKVQQIKQIQNNFWKRGVATAIATSLDGGFKYKVELYSYDRSFIGRRVIPCYQLKEELISLGFKNLDLLKKH